MGFIRVQMPVGLRKSGIPDSVLMPAPVTYAHRLVQRQAEVRKNGTLPWLRPDAKSQVTFQYDDGKIVGIDAVVLSTQHAEDIDQKSLQEAVMEEIIKPVLPAEWLNASTKFFINATINCIVECFYSTY